ncbi:MAG: hypothetical protein JW881_00975 [Spirochaetales bacterium]|nr:hypothetical protein [Spirochaetales bacterium]
MKSFFRIDEFKETIPEKVFLQLRYLIHESSLPDTEASLLKIVEAWLTKRGLFDKLLDRYNLKKVHSVSCDNPSACIGITLSGSIIALGPLSEDGRYFSYSSISLRTDVPPAVTAENVLCAEEILVNKAVSFARGPVRKTSPVMDIGVIDGSVSPVDQLAIVKKMNEALRGGFIGINKSMVDSEHSNKDLLRNKNDLFNKWIIIEWFLIGGLEKHIFLARAKLLWLELFTGVFEAIPDNGERDSRFLDFTNRAFGHFIDEYKWYESERKNFDIGLMKALEEIPAYDTYKKFVRDYVASLP